MTPMRIRAAFAFLAALLSQACQPIATTHHPEERLCADEPIDAETPRDGEIRAALRSGLARLARDHATATVRDLAEGLARRSAPLELSPTDSAVLTASEIHVRACAAVVIVGRRFLCDNCDRWHLTTASGFFITADGACITNRHVLEGADDDHLAVMTADGRVLAIESVLAAAADDDVAILKIAGDGFAHLPIREEVATGSAVHVLSHPAGNFWYLTSGTVARHFGSRSSKHEALDITADFARGSSGAPVIDSTGAAVGVARATRSIYYDEEDGDQRDLQLVLKRCVPGSAIMELLEDV